MEGARRNALLAGLLGLVLALVCGEIAYTHRRAEPYPGLFQPSFGSVPLNSRTVTTLAPEVVVVERDGSRRVIDYRSLLPSTTGVIETAVFRSGFYDTTRAEAPQTRAWLARRLQILQGNDDAVELVVQWQRVQFDLADGRRSVLAEDRRITVPLSSTP